MFRALTPLLSLPCPHAALARASAPHAASLRAPVSVQLLPVLPTLGPPHLPPHPCPSLQTRCSSALVLSRHLGPPGSSGQKLRGWHHGPLAA